MATWTKPSKNSASFSNASKHSASFTGVTKSTTGGTTIYAGTPMGLLLALTYATTFIVGGGSPLTWNTQTKH